MSHLQCDPDHLVHDLTGLVLCHQAQGVAESACQSRNEAGLEAAG